MRKYYKISPVVVLLVMAVVVTAGAALVAIWQSQVISSEFEIVGGILALLNPTHASYEILEDAIVLADTDSFLEFDGTIGVIENTAVIVVEDIYVGTDDLKLILDADISDLPDLIISCTAYYAEFYINSTGGDAVMVFDTIPMTFPVNTDGGVLALTVPNEWVDNITYSVPVEDLDPTIDEANGILAVFSFDESAVPEGTFGSYEILYQITALYVE